MVKRISDAQRSMAQAEKYGQGTIGYRIHTEAATGHRAGSIGHTRGVEEYAGHRKGTLGFEQVFGKSDRFSRG